MTDLQVRLQRTRDNYTATQNEAENLMHRMLEQRKNVSATSSLRVIGYPFLLLHSLVLLYLLHSFIDLLFNVFFLFTSPPFCLLNHILVYFAFIPLVCVALVPLHQKPQDAGSLNKMYTRQGYLFLLEKSESSSSSHTLSL